MRIAREAGYTTGMVAHYFDTKQDIIIAALRLILRRIEERLTPDAAGERPDLLTLLTEALPVDEKRYIECAFWMAFWGQVSADKRLKRINAWLHREYLRLFERCLARGWAEWRQWTAAVREQVLRSVVTFINGVTASAVASRPEWPAARQIAAAAAAARAAARLGQQQHQPRRRSRGAARQPPEEKPMDFALTEEQQLIIKTTRDFVRQELVPHEREVEDTGGLREELWRELQGQGDRRGPVRRQHAERGRRRRSRCGELGAVREGARPYQLRPAVLLRSAPLEHPARLRGRAARTLPATRGARRACRVPGDDRAAGGLRPAQHEDHRGAGGRGLRHQRHQAFHQPRRSCRLRHPVRRQRRGGVPRAASAGSSPRSSSTRALPASRYGPVTATSRTAVTPTASCSSPIAACRSPRCSARCTADSRSPTPGWERRACRWRRTALDARSARSRRHGSGRSIGCSSGSRSASSRASPSSSPTWRSSCARRSC